jgi:hypothetical protein
MFRRWGGGGGVESLRLQAIGLDGLIPVALGPGLRIELRNGVATITTTPVAPPQLRIVSKVLTQDDRGKYPCSKCERVYRNGVRMAPDIDYASNEGGIVPRTPWDPVDVVLGEWIGTEEPVPVAQAIPCRDWWRAPGCCVDPADSLDCPTFALLRPPRFAQ